MKHPKQTESRDPTQYDHKVTPSPNFPIIVICDSGDNPAHPQKRKQNPMSVLTKKSNHDTKNAEKIICLIMWFYHNTPHPRPSNTAQRMIDPQVLVSSILRLTLPPGVSGIVSPLLLPPPCPSPATSSSVSSSAASLLK